MFDIDELLAACVRCVAELDMRQAVRATLEQALQRPAEVADRMRPATAGMCLLHRSSQLTIIDAVYAPGMRIYPHDHRMWGAVAVYAGWEDNAFFRREGVVVTPSHAQRLHAGDVVLLDEAAVHAVSNPGGVPTASIHVYGGDFVQARRSQWVPPGLTEEPYDAAAVARVFAEANSAWDN
jgi:predicted metal-dependent enzyme (double-stranded beta helix superfamily)